MSQATRREFLARSAAVGAAAGLAGFGGFHVQAAQPRLKGTPNADKLGWRVGFSAYTFRGLTLFEALDKISAVGLRYTEVFAWQKLSPQHADATPGPGLSKTLRQDLKKKASDLGIQMIACYTGLDNAEAAKTFFEFAADMGFEALVSEPPEGVLDAIEKLTERVQDRSRLAQPSEAVALLGPGDGPARRSTAARPGWVSAAIRATGAAAVSNRPRCSSGSVRASRCST